MMRVFVFTFFISVLYPVATVWSQPDTIPVHLWNALPLFDQFTYREGDTLVLTGGNREIGVSTDLGKTFSWADAGMFSTTNLAFAAKGPIWRVVARLGFPSAYFRPEFSYDYGRSWDTSSFVGTRFSTKSPSISISGDGKRFCETADTVYTTTDDGKTWSAIPKGSYMAWSDYLHGGIVLANGRLIVTNDGGVHWDTAISIDISNVGQIKTLHAPATGVFTASSSTGWYATSDTGRTWIRIPYDITAFGSNLWYCSLLLPDSNQMKFFVLRSKNRGLTWDSLRYTCPNPDYLWLAFRDSLHAIALHSLYGVESHTSDGSQTWDCIDTSAHETVWVADPSGTYSYYSRVLFPYNSVAHTTDRGNSWIELPFILPSNYDNSLLNYSKYSTFLDGRYFYLDPTDHEIQWTADLGKTYKQLYYFTIGTGSFVNAAPDGTLWAGNTQQLYISRDSGNNWQEMTSTLPGSNADFTFIPVDSNTGFATSAYGFKTIDGGLTWQRDSMVPQYVIDSRHWLKKALLYNGGNVAAFMSTNNAGSSWDTILTTKGDTSLQFFAVDSVRWCFGGYYTTNAGQRWQRISGWDSTLNLVVFDSNTAFGQNENGYWRVDMPWYVQPQKAVDAPRESIIFSAIAAPNPVNDGTLITFGLAKQSYVKIELLDILGHEISKPHFESFFEQGNHAIPLSLHDLAAGTYYARLVTSYGETKAVKIVKE